MQTSGTITRGERNQSLLSTSDRLDLLYQKCGRDTSSATTEAGAVMLAKNAHMRYHNGQRGYVRCTLTPERWTSDYRVVPYVTRPRAPIRTDASFGVESGRAGVRRA